MDVSAVCINLSSMKYPLLFCSVMLLSTAAFSQEMECAFKSSSPPGSGIVQDLVPLVLSNDQDGRSMSWGGKSLENVQYEKSTGTWLGTLKLGTVKVVYARKQVTLKNEMYYGTMFFLCR